MNIFRISIISSLLTAALAFSACGTPPPTASGIAYTITNFGQASQGSSANNINNAGQVVGIETDLYQYRAVSTGWLYSGGKMQNLGLTGNVEDINDSGVVVGSAGATNTETLDYAFFRKDNGLIEYLGDTRSGAYAINAAGEIVGWLRAASGDMHAMIYRDGKMQDLGTLGGKASWANAVNATGQIVGTSNIASGDGHAFLYSGGKMKDLGTLGGKTSYANGINAAGQIVGGADTADGEEHAFLYSDGKMQDLGTLGGTSSSAAGINTAGQIVGWFKAGLVSHAFVYRDGKMLDLNDLAGKPAVTAVGNQFLAEGKGINDHGQIIGQGFLGCFLLTPLDQK